MVPQLYQQTHFDTSTSSTTPSPPHHTVDEGGENTTGWYKKFDLSLQSYVPSIDDFSFRPHYRLNWELSTSIETFLSTDHGKRVFWRKHLWRERVYNVARDDPRD